MKAWKISTIIFATLFSISVAYLIFYHITATKSFKTLADISNSNAILLKEKEREINSCLMEKDIDSSNLSDSENKLSICSKNFTKLLSEVSFFNISWESAGSHIGEYKIVCGPVVNINSQGSPIYIDIGFSYPVPGRFSVVSWDELTKSIFSFAKGKQMNICVVGLISLYKGIPQVIVNDYSQISIQ